MLHEVADGVRLHVSEFILSNTVVVRGDDGVLLIDPGITTAELFDLAGDLSGLGLRVVAGYSTHPDWDHTLWHAVFGDVPRYGTAANAAAMAELLAQPDWRDQLVDALPPEYLDDIPMELLGGITGLSEGATELPWNGPRARIIEHRAHARGHAALLFERSGVLVAGDMLSDILMPFLDLEADDPTGDYLAALDRFEDAAATVRLVVPGHGNPGGPEELRRRIAMDRAYVEAVRDGLEPDDPRLAPGAPLDWLPDVHAWQLQRLRGATA